MHNKVNLAEEIEKSAQIFTILLSPSTEIALLINNLLRTTIIRIKKNKQKIHNIGVSS